MDDDGKSAGPWQASPGLRKNCHTGVTRCSARCAFMPHFRGRDADRGITEFLHFPVQMPLKAPCGTEIAWSIPVAKGGPINNQTNELQTKYHHHERTYDKQSHP